MGVRADGFSFQQKYSGHFFPGVKTTRGCRSLVLRRGAAEQPQKGGGGISAGGAQTRILRLLFALVEQLACMLELHRLRSAESCFDFQARLKLKFLGIFEGFGSPQEGPAIQLSWF